MAAPRFRLEREPDPEWWGWWPGELDRSPLLEMDWAQLRAHSRRQKTRSTGVDAETLRLRRAARAAAAAAGIDYKTFLDHLRVQVRDAAQEGTRKCSRCGTRWPIATHFSRNNHRCNSRGNNCSSEYQLELRRRRAEREAGVAPPVDLNEARIRKGYTRTPDMRRRAA